MGHCDHTATHLPDGRILVAGGECGPGDVAEIFDPANTVWLSFVWSLGLAACAVVLLAVAVSSRVQCERIRAAGGQITREPGPVKGGTTMIAFVTDPDGYKIELIQRA